MYHFYYCSVGLLTVAGPIASLNSITNFVRNGYIYLCRKFIHCSQNIPLLFGAYYGSVGGGENDGGFFRMDIESSSSECLDYDEVDGLEEENPVHSSMLNALMQKLWTLVDDENGEVDLYMTDEGSKLYAPDETGVWMSSLFDGDALDQISNEWKLGLAFES